MSEDKKTRETREIKTPKGRCLVLKTYITGREAREIQNIYLEKMNLRQTKDGQQMDGLKGSATGEAENKAIEIVIVSLDGESNDVVNSVLDLELSEYNFIKKEIDKVTNPQLDEDKKKV